MKNVLTKAAREIVSNVMSEDDKRGCKLTHFVAEGEPEMETKYYDVRGSRDVNGNKTVKVIGTDGRSFSVQTNGNLPGIHRQDIPHRRQATHSERREIECYIQNYGTDRQGDILGLEAVRLDTAKDRMEHYKETYF